MLEARPVSYGKATSYLPVIELLKDYFRIADRDTQRDILDKVTEKILALDPALEPTLSRAARPPGRAVRGSPVAGPRPVAAPAADTGCGQAPRRARDAGAATSWWSFEDLHWIDTETQAFLDSLVESLPTAPLLLLVDYRPEYRHTWGSKMYYTQLRLDPLSPESAEDAARRAAGP